MKLDYAAVEALLTRRFATPVRIAEAHQLTPWFVARCRLESGSPQIPTSVVVKTLREDPNGFRTNPRQVVTEQVALEFLEEVAPGRTPRLWAGDPEAGLLILEDLTPRVPLAAVLGEGWGDDAVAGLRRLAAALGELAALTSDRGEDYEARLRVGGRSGPLPVRQWLRPGVWDQVRSSAAQIGTTPSAATENELATVVDELREPGNFRALSSGDSGPNNYMVFAHDLAHGDARLIDFEAGGWRHAVEDAVFLYVPGPHWITVSDPVADGSEAAYRTALSESVPEAEDDTRFGQALAAACLAFAILRLHRFPQVDARDPDHPARQQLVSTLEAAARTAEKRASLPNLSGWASQVAESLRRRWPDSDLDFDAMRPYTLRHADHPLEPVAMRIPTD